MAGLFLKAKLQGDQSILKEISPEYSLEGLKLKLQYFGHLMQRTDSLEKILILGKIEGRRRRVKEDKMVGWHHWFNGHGFEQAPGDSEGQGSLVCCSLWGQKESDRTERLHNSKIKKENIVLCNLWMLYRNTELSLHRDAVTINAF